MIVVVSGLPRSGTSMMMAMLAAGGLPVLADESRPPDADNPNGYFEYAKVKRLAEDNSWLGEAEGKAVKVVSALLQHLPRGRDYRVIFMTRDLDEVLASQADMLARRGANGSEADMKAHFTTHLARLKEWMRRQPNMHALRLDYRSVVAEPLERAAEAARFLGLALDIGKMAAAVAPGLHRHRAEGTRQ